MLNGYFKVDQKGASFIVATFFNPNTGDTITKTVRDYDYADRRNDNDELYYMPIDQNARIKWMHHNGQIVVNDTIEVFKGRKVKVGTVARVTAIKPVYDRYGRWVADYAHLDNGQRTNVTNCKLVA